MSVLEIARAVMAKLRAQQGSPSGRASPQGVPQEGTEREEQRPSHKSVGEDLPSQPTDDERDERNEQSLPSRTTVVGQELLPYQLIRDAAGLQAVAAAVGESRLVALDLETTGLDPRRDRVRLLSLSYDNRDGGRFAHLVDCFAVDPRSLFAALACRHVVAHHAAFDLAFLAAMGFQPNAARDTMLLSQLFWGVRQPAGFHKLETCLQRELRITLDKFEQQSNWSQPSLSAQQLSYAAGDVAHLHRLHAVLDSRIKNAGLERAAAIEGRSLPAIAWLAHHGVAFDLHAWLALATGAEAEAVALEAQLDRQAPERPGTLPGTGCWNWKSPVDVKNVFATLGSALASTNDDALASIDHPLGALLRRYRAAGKRASTYGRDWSRFIADGRLYPRWRQLGALTGRMSCSDPNLQNLPRNPAYRRCFAAPPGRVLVKADYSQIELRIAAKIADEGCMIDAYKCGRDLHALTAQRMTGKSVISSQERQLAKPVNFGLIYGLGAKALRQKANSEYGLELSQADAARYRHAFFSTYPGIKRWHDQICRDHATETRTLTGRRVLVEANGFFGAKANYMVQGTGGDGIKLALALLWERRHEAPGAFPILAIHDEIVVECDRNQAGAVEKWLREAMLDALASLLDPVPVAVEVKIAETWGG